MPRDTLLDQLVRRVADLHTSQHERQVSVTAHRLTSANLASGTLRAARGDVSLRFQLRCFPIGTPDPGSDTC
jgi:hypothetical protein